MLWIHIFFVKLKYSTEQLNSLFYLDTKYRICHYFAIIRALVPLFRIILIFNVIKWVHKNDRRSIENDRFRYFYTKTSFYPKEALIYLFGWSLIAFILFLKAFDLLWNSCPRRYIKKNPIFALHNCRLFYRGQDDWSSWMRKVRTTQSIAPPNGWGPSGYRECRRK